MSNDIVGRLYLDVIDGVINESRMDFEDSGVDESTLQELKLIWEQGLTSLNIAKLPWEPNEITPPASLDNGNLTNLNNRNGSNGTILNPQDDYKLPRIKQELDDLEFSNPSAAAIRAAQQVQQISQDRGNNLPGADATIKGIMRKGGLDEPNKGGLVLPGGGQLTQTDGLADESDERNNKKNSENRINRFDADKLIEHSWKRHRDQNQLTKVEELSSDLAEQLESATMSKIFQGDAANDDSDGINSELDDSDDENNSGGEDNDDESGMIMLCLYDKVQRVKNKWKYVLKDGVANINGKDYVFSRGSGESEW